MIGIYARVSTSIQSTENQLLELRRYVKARGWKAIEYIDEGISGIKTENQRPALNSLMKAARRRQIDSVVVWDFSRFARSMRQLVDALDSFRAWGISFISLREGIDTTTANGRLMFGIFASLAEFERELIRERVLLGLNRARKLGKKLGRPRIAIGLEQVHEMHSKGLSLRQIGSELGISKDSVRKVLLVSKKPPSKLTPNPLGKTS